MTTEARSLEVRRAGLALMDAADLLEAGREREARARVEEALIVLQKVFSPEVFDGEEGRGLAE